MATADLAVADLVATRLAVADLVATALVVADLVATVGGHSFSGHVAGAPGALPLGLVVALLLVGLAVAGPLLGLAAVSL